MYIVGSKLHTQSGSFDVISSLDLELFWYLAIFLRYSGISPTFFDWGVQSLP